MKTVLFYSFKGGVGRTQTMFNIAKYLSQKQNKKILLVDFDLYAPGLSYISDFKRIGGNKDKKYLSEFLVETFQGDPSLRFYIDRIDKNLYLIPVYNMKNIRRYHDLLAELSQYLYSLKKAAEKRKEEISTPADSVFKYIVEIIKIQDDSFDYIFFDARTGITEVSDILFSNFLDIKVFISSFNEQNIQGTNDILDLLSEQVGMKHSVLRILSPKPIDEKRKEYKDIYKRANLDYNEKLRAKFNWLGTFEISYEEEIVTNDFNVWEELDDDSSYKKQIITIANQIVDQDDSEEILRYIK